MSKKLLRDFSMLSREEQAHFMPALIEQFEKNFLVTSHVMKSCFLSAYYSTCRVKTFMFNDNLRLEQDVRTLIAARDRSPLLFEKFVASALGGDHINEKLCLSADVHHQGFIECKFSNCLNAKSSSWEVCVSAARSNVMKERKNKISVGPLYEKHSDSIPRIDYITVLYVQPAYVTFVFVPHDELDEFFEFSRPSARGLKIKLKKEKRSDVPDGRRNRSKLSKVQVAVRKARRANRHRSKDA